MPMGSPINLAMLRQALIDRCYVDANDPRLDSGNLNRILNEAMQRFDMAAPIGWPFDWGTTVVNLGQFIDSYIWTLGGGGGPHKVSYVLVADAAGQWQFPLERLTREEQLDRYPLDSFQGIPQTYSIMGWADNNVNGEPTAALYLRPALNTTYVVTIAGFTLMPELASDGDPPAIFSDHMIGDWNAALIEYAAALIYRAADDLSEAVSALNDFDAQVLEHRKVRRRTYGPGVPNFPGSAVSDTIA